jgi:hypothetical protein
MCELCRKEVTTYVKTDFSPWVFALGIFVLYFYGLKYGIFLLALLCPLFRNVIHSCPYCFDILLVNNFYPIQVKDKYCWLQYGKCIIILRMMYIYLFLIVVLSFGFYININQIFNPDKTNTIYKDHTHEIDDKVKEYYSGSTLTWADLIKDCGAYVMIENSARANEVFSRRYYKRVIEWKGYFLNAFVQSRNPMDFNPEHLMNLNIRMIPSESIQNPDLFLSLDFRKFTKYANLIRTFSTGTPIKFRASLEALGNEWRSHHLHLIDIEKTEDFIEHDKKVVLFQGINFNITGHLMNEQEIQELHKISEKNSEGVIVTDVKTISQEKDGNGQIKNSTIHNTNLSNSSKNIETNNDTENENKLKNKNLTESNSTLESNTYSN